MNINPKQMECKICGNESTLSFEAKILNQYQIKYFHCKNCYFLQTEKPYWLKEAYSESINISDTGIMVRNQNMSQITTLIIFFLFDRQKSFLDFAGGYGILTRVMRDIGFDFYWTDKYSSNLVSRGFELSSNKKYEMATAFEAFEHFEYPLVELENILKVTDSLLFSTDLSSNEIQAPAQWWYYGLEHGQHISFYNIKSLEYLAQKYKLNLYSNKTSIHLLTRKKISKLLFWFILKINRFGLYYLISSFLSSKTGDDMNQIVKKLKSK
jgi:hypothetical protein